MHFIILVNFILHHFASVSLNNFIIFHCWHTKDLHAFIELNRLQYNYAQYFHVNEIIDTDHFHYHFLRHKLPKLGVFLDMNCKNSANILQAASEERIYTQHYHWLLYDEHANMNYLINTFSHANLAVNADVTYFMPKTEFSNTKEISFITFDVYNKGYELGGKLNITIDQEFSCNITECRLERYLSELYKRSRLNQRRNLEGLTLRVAAVVESKVLNYNYTAAETHAHLSSIDAPSYNVAPRLNYQLRLLLKDELKCNYTYILTDQWSTGVFIGGMIGELINGTAEIATAPFIMTAERTSHVTALTQVMHFHAICIFRTPKNAELRADAFLAPFTALVWFLYVGLLLIIGVMLWYIFRLEQNFMWRNYLDFLPSIMSTWLISFGSACSQGADLVPRSIGGRVVFVALMLFTDLMYNYYTSDVLSLLLGGPPRSPIKTVQQLAESSLPVAVDPKPYTRNYIEVSPRSDIRSLYAEKIAKKDANTIYISPEVAALKMRDNPGFVYISDDTSAYKYILDHFLPYQICELNEIPLRPESAIDSVVNKNMSYKELVKLFELRTMETGILRKHLSFWVRHKLYCYDSNHVEAVGLIYTAPLFILLICAYVFSLGILCLEILWKRFIHDQQHLLFLERF